MNYEIKPGNGTIFKNNKTSDKQPEYKGIIKTPEGKELEIALWVKEGKSGKFFSVKVQEPYSAEEPTKEPVERDDNDDLPF